jgi:hypothetical protein
MFSIRSTTLLAVAGVVLAAVGGASAQENYEIQVYGSETTPPGRTMIELHSNFTIDGRKQVEDRLSPTYHAWHETLEITRGLTSWSEVGFYIFTSIGSDHSWRWVGSHIRPRIRAPEQWHWPVGAGLSAEVGYQRRDFSADSWNIELRPIIDKQFGRWYASFNPTLDRALRTEGPSRRVEFSPNATLTCDATHKVNLGLEYYGGLGPIGRFAPVSQQQHQLFGVTNLNVGADWEVNFGYGVALTDAGDRRLVKLILGRRY